jgi:NAD(P)H-dependent FMN reductase
MRILALDGSLGGDDGNSSVLLDAAVAWLRAHATVARGSLARAPGFAAHSEALAAADALVIATGTYWDSWSSLLQQFLEQATPSEGTPVWLGKPVAVLVTAHSVGGKGVLSRLQGVLSTFGAQIPPMGGLVITRAGELARSHAEHDCEDMWCVEDVAVVCHNLLACARGLREFRAWPVDRGDPRKRWLQGG